MSSTNANDGECTGAGERGGRGRPGPSSTRRRILAGTVTLTGMALAGCLSGDDAPPSAVAIDADAACDVCGMIISKHPGPNGELFWDGLEPEEHDPPFQFDSLKQCLFPNYFEQTDAGRTLDAGYATDYSAVEYTVSTGDGTSYISSTTTAASLAPLADLVYVVGSDVEGAMGPDFVPFGVESDAESFASEHGGSVVAFEDITPALTGR